MEQTNKIPALMTTEELKREMYRALSGLQACIRTDRVPFASLPDFENWLEAYLQRLGNEREGLSAQANMADVLRDAYERQKGLTSAACQSERESYAEVRELRDETEEMRGRIASLELAAASAQRLWEEGVNTNRLAGEELRRRGEIIEQQKQEIDSSRSEADGLLALLRMHGYQITPSDAYHLVPATSHQFERENAQEAPSRKPQGHPGIIRRLMNRMGI